MTKQESHNHNDYPLSYTGRTVSHQLVQILECHKCYLHITCSMGIWHLPDMYALSPWVCGFQHRHWDQGAMGAYAPQEVWTQGIKYLDHMTKQNTGASVFQAIHATRPWSYLFMQKSLHSVICYGYITQLASNKIMCKEC